MDRRESGTCSLPSLPPGLLPSAFAGDELTVAQGISQALLPTTSELFQQQQQWPPTDWPQLLEAGSTQWSSHCRGLCSPTLKRSMIPGLSDTCQPDCTVHSEAFHAAAVLLNMFKAWPGQHIQHWQPGKNDEILFWLVQQLSPEASSPSSPSSSFADLSFQPTRQDAELLRICKSNTTRPPYNCGRWGLPFSCLFLAEILFATDNMTSFPVVNFISRFKASLDGESDMNSSPYLKQYIPFCLHSPLLIQTAIYTSACYLIETAGEQRLDSMTAMSHKCRAIRMLNEHLQVRGSTTDEAIASVMQLMLNEWYWGDADDLMAHLSGLREMVRLRGGFANLGLGGLLAKLVIV